jgi:nucleotide-binding universal stress UspA family protein
MDVDANRTNRPLGSLAALGSTVGAGGAGGAGAAGAAGGAGKSKRLLVPLDGSGLPETLLSHAASLARASSSLLTLLQVVPPFVFYDPMGTGLVPSPAAWEAWEEEPGLAREYLRGVADALNKQGVNADTIVLQGDPAGTIVEYTKQHPEVRMIAMATHGRTRIRRWIMGSVAERVLHSSPVPLLLVRAFEQDISVAPSPMDPAAAVGSVVPRAAAHEEQWYRTIMVPLDGSRFAEQALDEAQVLAAQFNATLLLVSVVPPFDYVENTVETAAIPLWVDNAEDEPAASMVRYLSGVAQRLQDKGLKVQPEVVPGNPAEEILRRSEAGKADLVVMASHGRTGLQRLWLGSVAMKVVHAAKTPVLLVRVGAMAEGTTDKKLATTPRV